MATGIQISPPSDITVGTTDIINGTNGTLLRNESGVVGDTDYTVPKLDGTAGQVLQTNGAGVVSFQTISTGITVGTTSVTSGTDGRVFFQAGGVVQQDAGFIFNSTAKTLTNYGKGAIATNTSFGASALTGNTTGNSNTAFGNDALVRNTTGSANTAIGFAALNDVAQWGFTGSLNVGVGYYAGAYISSGVQNTMIGANAGTSIRTGNHNTIVGPVSGLVGTSNWAVLADGQANIAIWKNSSHFVGIGYNAPTTDTLGAKLDVRAQGALSTDLAFRVRNSADNLDIIRATGAGDVFIGIGAGNSSTGANVTALGVNSLRSNTSGSHNTSFGHTALFSITTSAANTAMGSLALINLTSGDNNIAFGFNSGRYISSGANLTISNSSLFIGNGTRPDADNQTNQIVIGNAAIGAGSNTATLGNTSIVKTILRGTINAAGLPTSPVGLVAGDIWNNGGVLNIV